MITKTNYVTSIDAKRIFVRQWLDLDSQHKPKAVVHIAHGIAEHSGRYSYAAERLVKSGYIVVAHDHRGHGATASDPKELGHYADRYGWQLVISDTHAVNQHIHEQYPDLPIIALGHSIGCFIMQKFMADHPGATAGCILSAPTFTSPIFARAATLLTTMEKLRLGRRRESRLIQQLIFGQYNKAFRPNRTPYDWLSRNPQVADSYMLDQKCGFTGSTQLWQDLLQGISELYTPETLSRMPKIPHYIFAGAEDPVSDSASGVRKLVRKLRGAGITDLTTKIYPEGRHEMLNEVNQGEVMKDLITWLDSHHTQANHEIHSHVAA